MKTSGILALSGGRMCGSKGVASQSGEYKSFFFYINITSGNGYTLHTLNGN